MFGMFYIETNISINDMNKFEKTRTNKEENIYKKHLVWLVPLVN